MSMTERELEERLEEQKQTWLWKTGSGDAQTRGGYVEGINDAKAIVRRSRAEAAELRIQLRDESYLADELAERTKEFEAEAAELRKRLAECTDRRGQLAKALGIDERLLWEDVKLEISKWEELERENAELRERVESLGGALQRMVYRTEQFLDELEKRSVRMPMWKVMTIQEALRLAHVALPPANAQAKLEKPK